MRKATCHLIHVLLLISAFRNGFAQNYRQLSILGTIQLPEQQEGGIAIMEPIKCSPDGELYIRFARGTPELGVIIVSSDKKQVRRVSITDLPELNGSYLLDFTPGSNHSVSFLIGKRTTRDVVEHDIVTFKNDGTSTVSKIDAHAGVSLRQIANLGLDTFAMAGFAKSTGKGETSYLGIFDDRGQLLKDIVLSGDLQAQGATKSKPLSSDGEPINAFASWLELSTLQTADDGRAFLMRRNPEGPVFLISPSGLVQPIKLQSPEETASLSSVKVRNGTIAAEYYSKLSHPHSSRVHYITLTDIATGLLQQVIRYEGSQVTGVGMVCYAENGFNFLSQASDGHLQVVTAIGR